jgi:hypothetical protein
MKSMASMPGWSANNTLMTGTSGGAMVATDELSSREGLWWFLGRCRSGWTSNFDGFNGEG